MIALLFDTETSGLIDNHSMPLDKQPEIIEFYSCVVDFTTGELLEDIDELIKPQRPVSDEITKITSIDNDMLADKPPFSKIAGRIRAAIERAPVVIAHNLSFDMEMLDIEFERLNETLLWPRRKLCTVEATVHLKGFRLNLTALHELLFNERFPEAHRAKHDVQALTRCALELHRIGEI